MTAPAEDMLDERDPAYAVRRDDGETLWFNGALVTIKTPSAWSAGAFSLVELAMPQGRATGLHSDPSDETIHVLEGELLVHVDGAEHRALLGDTLAIARGVPHALLAVEAQARVLVLNTPGTHDEFFRLGGVPALDRDLASAPPPDFARTQAAAQAVGVQLLGPPPFSRELIDQTSG